MPIYRTATADLPAALLRAGFLASVLAIGAFAAAPAFSQDSSAESAENAESTENAESAENAESMGDASGALPPVETLSEDTVVGRVGDREITHGEVLIAAQQLGPQYVQGLSQLYPLVVQRLIDLELVTQAALQAGLDEEPVVVERMEEARKAVLRDYFLERRLMEAVNDDAVAARYAAFLEENPPEQEIKARHILLEDEEAAKAVITELDGGADFAELAKERSTGPSGANGGDLGYFTPGTMVEAFSDAAFELEPGSYSKMPVQTQFGWHVILVEDARETTPPALEEVRDQLAAEIQQESVQSLLDELRTSGNAENLRDPEGEFSAN